MVVTCERCRTQFQLDEARVPETGVLVRCSRCKHAFVVQRPAATEEEAVENAVARAVKQSETPEVTRDLPADPSSRSLFDDEETESDWEFNDDPPLVSDGPEEPASEPVPRIAEPAADPGGPSSALVAPPRPAPRPAPIPSQREPEPEVSDELGSPGEWDIFDDDEPPARAADVPAPAPRRSATPPRLRRAEDLEPDESPAPNVWAERATNAAGWLATAVLCAVGFARGLAAPPPVSVTLAPPAEGIVLEGVSGRWVDNARLGRLLVVSGGLHNTREAHAPVATLELVLRDAGGREVGAGTPLGAPRPEAVLREGGPPQLRASLLPPLPLGPGETRAFESVSWPLPREAVGFEIRPTRERDGSG